MALAIEFFMSGELSAMSATEATELKVVLEALSQYHAAQNADVLAAITTLAVEVAKIKEIVMTHQEKLDAAILKLEDLATSVEALKTRVEQGDAALVLANQALAEQNAAKDAHITEQDANIAALQAALNAATANGVNPASIDAIQTSLNAIDASVDAFKAVPSPEPIPTPDPVS